MTAPGRFEIAEVLAGLGAKDDSATAQALRARALTPRVREAYARHVASFDAWARVRGLQTRPASGEAVALWLFSCRRRRPGTLRIYSAALSHAHREAGLPDPGRTPIVQRVLDAATRDQGAAPVGVEAFDANEIAEVALHRVARGSTGEAMTARGAAAAVLARAGLTIAVCSRLSAGAVVHVGQGRYEVAVPTQWVRQPDGSRVRVDAGTLTLAASSSGGGVCPVAALDALHERRPDVASLFGFGTDAHLQDLVALAGGASGIAGNLRQQLRSAAARARITLVEDPYLGIPDLTNDAFARLVAHVNPSHLLNVRNRATRLTQAALGERHSGVANMLAETLEWSPAGARVVIGHSKVDPEGRGKRVLIPHTPGHPPTCPACAVREWVDEAQIVTGPLFRTTHNGRVTEDATSLDSDLRAVKEAAAAHGIDKRVGTHSFRKGHVRARALNGEDALAIGATTGQSAQTIHRHYAGLRAFEGAVLDL